MSVPSWTEEQIRTAMASVMHTIGDQAKIEAVIERLKSDDE